MTRHDMNAHAAGGRLAALVLRHAKLDAAIEAEQARPVPDSGALQMFKRKRLILKEEIHRLGSTHVPRAQAG